MVFNFRAFLTDETKNPQGVLALFSQYSIAPRAWEPWKSGFSAVAYPVQRSPFCSVCWNWNEAGRSRSDNTSCQGVLVASKQKDAETRTELQMFFGIVSDLEEAKRDGIPSIIRYHLNELVVMREQTRSDLLRRKCIEVINSNVAAPTIAAAQHG
jgi:hypothetical protein